MSIHRTLNGRRPLGRFAAVATTFAFITTFAPTPLAATGATPQAVAGLYDPARALGPLFSALQLSDIFEDSKTFADAKPRLSPVELVKRFAAARAAAGFDLRSLANRYQKRLSAGSCQRCTDSR